MAEPALPVRVKICGVRSVAAATAAADAGADLLGLNFHPGSPRRVDEATAAAIVAALAPSACAPVGVFVDRPAAEVAALAGRVGLRRVQLHGDEPPADVAALRGAGLEVIKAFRLAAGSEASPARWLREAAGRPGALPDAVLVDAAAPGQHGGTGRLLEDAPLARFLDVLGRIGEAAAPRLILAGGLTPGNVAGRIAAVGAARLWAVDAASGVESAPGEKDAALVAAFVRAAKQAAGVG